MDWPRFSLLAFGCLVLAGLSTAAEQIEKRPPNVIVIFCDNLGYGDIEPFGSTLHRTPNLNRMAREGRRFTHFYVTAGVCTPSRASLMTGCYAQRVHMHWNERDRHVLRPVSPYGLHPDEITIAEILKARGYATACIGKWHLGDQPAFLPTRQGFDEFFGIPYSDDMTARTWKEDGSTWPPLPLMDQEKVVEAPANRDTLTKRYTERAIDFIKRHRSQPFFLYLPHAMPGSTAHPFASEAFQRKSRNGSWGDSVEELDWSLGALLDCLQELDLATNTLVFWTSDNGTPTTGKPGDPSRGSNAPLHGRGYTTAEGAFRVPALAWQPGRVPPGTTCEALCSTMDLLPTAAALAGAELTRAIDGHDIRNLLFSSENEPSPYQAFFYYHTDQLQAVRSGPWKLFLPLVSFQRHPHFPPGTKKTPPLLFNVVEDVSCRHNRAADHPEVVADLTALAEQARSELGDRNTTGKGQRPIGRVENPTPQVMRN